MTDDSDLALARDLMRFVDQSPTPYHAVAEAAQRLDAAGFTRLDERDPWSIEPGTCAYLVRSGGTLIALRGGRRPPPDAGFLLVGAHTDSPGLRVKPQADVHASNYLQIGVEVYGGPLWYTWIDRDLSVAGRVVLRGGATHLIRFDRSICRIPSLAIHLHRNVNKGGLTLNAQDHLVPMLLMEEKEGARSFLDLLTAEVERVTGVKVSAEDVLGYDLCLHDGQQAVLGGADGDLIFASRLDNLVGCHAALSALLKAEPRDATQLIVLYDHEETGSRAASGAQSRLLLSVIERLVTAYGASGPEAIGRALARSLLVSADMAHAVHPNYADKHDRQHRPMLGQGPVIKISARQAYATDGPAAAVFAEACHACGFEPQRYAARSDIASGSTIGPISAARTGIRTVDVGSAMLSMHSCREVAGARDVEMMIRALGELLSRGEVPPAEV